MENAVHKLRQAGEFYAAAVLEYPEKSPLWRHSYATAEFFRHADLPPYTGLWDSLPTAVSSCR